MSVRIAVLYQQLLGIYGDRGNAMVLAKRATWRGFDTELRYVDPGDPVPAANIYLLGGGEDKAQISAVRALQADGGLHSALADGAALFAVCAGYQICGNTFTVGENDTVIEGLGLLDVDTRRGPQRAVGEIVTRWTKPDGTTELITGFENHGGFTTLGQAAKPFASVVHGIGNGDGTEGAVNGAVNGKVIGSYPHGPNLARNPALADHLLSLALETELPALDRPDLDAAIATLRSQRFAAVERH